MYPNEKPPPYIDPPRVNIVVDPLDAFPTWLKWIIKVGIVICGVLAIINGVVGFFLSFLAPSCLFSNIIILIVGFLVFAFEAPILCTCIGFLAPISRFSQKLPPWIKMIFYIVPAIAAIALCPAGANVWIGSLGLVGVGLVYFYLTFTRGRY